MIQQKKTVLMVFDDMKADMESKKKNNSLLLNCF